MKYKIISTGSKGNATIFNDSIMIDCGVSFKMLKDVYRRLKIVCLTHKHSDHFSKTTVKRLAKERPTLRFACCEWMHDLLTECGVKEKNIDILKIDTVYDYKIFKISPIMLYHDVPNCGWRLFAGGEKIIYATDTSTLQGISAKGYDLYMIEANYEDDEIENRISEKSLKGEYAYEYRARNNHLSKKQCDEFIAENYTQNSKFIYMHRHEEKEND